MKLAAHALALLTALQAQVPPAAPGASAPAQDPAQASAADPVEAPPPEHWTGTLSEGLAEVRAALAANAREDVLGLAARIGLAARADGVEPARAARVLHDLGLARAGVDDLAGALADLRAAAGAAGPGAVRESALYAAGTAQLLRAEALRREVPEIAHELGLPEPPEQPAGDGGGGPDALDIARQAYLTARGSLLERLRVDALHADTRANLELVTRRLRELDALQREREKQKQEQEQEQQKDPNPDQPPKDPDAKQEPQEPKDPQEPEDSEQKPPEQEQDPKAEPQDKPQDEPKPEDAPPEPQESEAEPKPKPQEGQVEERVLSREEVQRLLDQLDEIEKEAQAVRARLLERRRKPVAKDW